MTNQNVQTMKGFRNPPKPTKGEVEKENQTLGQELTQRIQSLQQFFGNLINQLMQKTKSHDQELNQVSVWLASNPTSDAAKKGDNLLMDYAGALLSEDGSLSKVTVETAEGPKEIVDYFDGGSGKLFMLNNLGGGTLIEGFEEQLVGLKGGEGKEIEVQFPKEYGVKSLQERKARFTVFIHEVRRPFANSSVGDLVDENQRIRDAVKAKAISDAQAAAVKAQAEKDAAKTEAPADDNGNKGPGADSVPAAQESTNAPEATIPAPAEAPAAEAAPEQAPSS